ncbi:MAG: tryptophan-rich sensory protein [Gammaproteobacteria bacterium]|jgi:tryptophan-rich sensory protein|nr:MAG: tryptophan-rich sensory protein [Gammaproteobacteria bacterium]
MSAMGRHSLLGLIGWLVLAYAASAIGAIASVEAAAFYGQLVQPPWAPPPWLFGPVWTVLYTMMGVAAWFVWREGGVAANRVALALFLLQLGLNALWSWLFFTWNLGGIAFAEILVLWAFILATLIAFWKVRTVAGALLVPYLLWVTFAAMLNYTLWQQNPQVL